MSERPYLRLDSVVARTLGRLAGLDVVDIGCGTGAVTRRLAALGARVTGVEPDERARAMAEAAGGGPGYVAARAEATGLPDACADLVVFANSLHHCADMPGALAEAVRLLRRGGRLAIIEPEACDPVWSVMRHLDDERPAYDRARAALDALVADGRALRLAGLHYAGRYRVETAEAMIADLQAVDPARRADAAARRALASAFALAVEHDRRGGFIPCWSRIEVLRIAA